MTEGGNGTRVSLREFIELRLRDIESKLARIGGKLDELADQGERIDALEWKMRVVSWLGGVAVTVLLGVGIAWIRNRLGL